MCCWCAGSKVALVRLGFLLLFFQIQPTSQQHKRRRSPLEIGYVQFTIPPHHSPTVNHDVSIHLPSVVAHGHNASATKNHAVLPLFVHRDEWLPGHVENHAFIPGRIHHVLVPSSAVIVTHPVHSTVLVHSVSVHPEVTSLYRKHYGGFGVGIDYGGHGAGHGFHVL